MTKKIILFSYNPVPTPEYTTIEGSALRFWRMALGLKKYESYDITIAVWEKFPQKYKEAEGFRITNFNADPQAIKELTQGYDAVVLSCAMGGLSKTIFDALDPNSTTIIDAYSPMYVEFLTKSTDKTEDDQWLGVYEEYINVFNELLAKADYVLIGNDNQKHFYRGVLGATGALVNHNDNKFITLPAYVESVKAAAVKKSVATTGDDRLNVLWFGGVYPWFDINSLITAFSHSSIKKIARLTIVGGSNPFYPKDNKRFNGKYMAAKAMAEKLGLLKDKTVILKDWIEYKDRIEEFKEADIAVTINNTFIENQYSFRLRVADLAGNGVPIITNGEDCLGEALIDQGVAFRLNTQEGALTQSLKNILSNKNAIKLARRKLSGKKIYDSLHIYHYIPPLISAINAPKTKRVISSFVEKVEPSTPGTPKTQDFSINSIAGVSTSRVLRVTLSRVKRVFLSRLGIKY